MGINLYIGVPIGALCCFLFILFSFMEVPKTKQVKCFWQILSACILWTAGAVLMRARFTENIGFWFHVSLLGLFLIPIFMYRFLFCILEIKKDGFLVFFAVITCVLTILNGKWAFILSPPEMIHRADGGVAYTYHVSPGVYIFALAELVLLIYVTVLTHIQIHGDVTLKKKLFPLLLGTIFIFAGNMLELIPGNVFPYDTLGGVLMALCLVYIMYRRYLFDISYRMTIGCIYSTALIIILLPFWNLRSNLRAYIGEAPVGVERKIWVSSLLLTAWALEIVYLARKMAGHVTQRRRAGQLEVIKTFQNDTASLFGEEELYERIVRVCESIISPVEVYILLRRYNEKEITTVKRSEGAEPLTGNEEVKLLRILNSMHLNEHVEIVPLKYDNEIQGCIYLKLPAKSQIDYFKLEDLRQIGTYTSLCIKNMGIYQDVYQNSIHDELTGLYNRTYYREFKKRWNFQRPQSMIYMDMDDFKLFNELYGENTGDEILQWSAGITREEIGEAGTVMRLGSNEFLICTQVTEKAELLQMVKRLQEKIAKADAGKPKVLQPITFSIGISSSSEADFDMDELLKQAERASFFAKKNGKNCVKLYEVGVEEIKEEEQKTYEQIAPTIFALTAAIDAKDSYTFEHSCNVSEYAVILAKEIGLENDDVQIVKEAGLLHDIGKIGIPESILKKTGRLTEEEFEIMKKHVENSIEMIHFLPNMSYVIPAVVAHHERYDGKGYPRGIRGESIPLLGRILTVCDCFDAMTSKRTYKDAMPVSYAMGELEKNSGTQFDPKLAETFLKLIREGKIVV